VATYVQVCNYHFGSGSAGLEINDEVARFLAVKSRRDEILLGELGGLEREGLFNTTARSYVFFQATPRSSHQSNSRDPMLLKPSGTAASVSDGKCGYAPC
jgi:hypothetical protein